MSRPPMNQVDMMFRRTLVFSKLFTKSWGRPGNLKRMRYFRENYMSKGIVMELIERKPPKMVITKEYNKSGVLYMEGYFKSPLASYAPELFITENLARASWKALFPMYENKRKGFIVHLAGTGDQTYYRREYFLAKDLLQYGISAILLENPFYGSRRPKDQFRVSLQNVSDLFIMGGALMAECCFLLKWALENGHWPLGLSGISMGGHMASLAATNMPIRTALVPCLSWTSASPVYTTGALSMAINWKILEHELNSPTFRESLKNIPNCFWLDMIEENKGIPKELSNSYVKRLMWIMMEEFTNLANYPIPVDTSLVRAIVAEEDAYVLRSPDIPNLTEIWPKAQVQVLSKKGHIEAYFSDHALFRKTIVDLLKDLENSSTNIPEISAKNKQILT